MAPRFRRPRSKSRERTPKQNSPTDAWVDNVVQLRLHRSSPDVNKQSNNNVATSWNDFESSNLGKKIREKGKQDRMEMPLENPVTPVRVTSNIMKQRSDQGSLKEDVNKESTSALHDTKKGKISTGPTKIQTVLAAVTETKSLNSKETSSGNSKLSKSKERKAGKFLWLRKGSIICKEPNKKLSPATSESDVSKLSEPDPVVAAATATTPVVEPEPLRREMKECTPLQLQLWVSEINRAIDEAKREEEQRQAEEEERRIKEEQERVQEEAEKIARTPTAKSERDNDGIDKYYQHTRDTGVYVDYSTFDDGESISSIDLLFKWLTCRELSPGEDDKTHSGGTNVDAHGLVVSTNSMTSEALSSIEEDAKPRRRLLLTR